MKKKAVLSIDFDAFIRSLDIWDWEHTEDVLFFHTLLWTVRMSSPGVDIIDETSPSKFADFMPDKLGEKLIEIGMDMQDLENENGTSDKKVII